jgi:hypothetical protein
MVVLVFILVMNYKALLRKIVQADLVQSRIQEVDVLLMIIIVSMNVLEVRLHFVLVGARDITA